MKIRDLSIALLAVALAACGRAEAEVSLKNDLPVEAMVVSDDERHAEVEAEVAAVAQQRDETVQ